MLQFMRLQGVGDNLANKQQQIFFFFLPVAKNIWSNAEKNSLNLG